MTQNPRADWRPLYRIGALGAFLMLLTVPAQIVVFAINPPPDDVLDWFALYAENPVLAMLNLDLVYAASQGLMVPLVLAVAVSVWDHRPALALAGASVMLFAITIHTTSNPSIEMLSASWAYAAADSDAERAIVQAAGETLLYRWTGTSYAVGYIVAGFGLILLSAATWDVYSRFATWLGFVLGVTWFVPASFGTIGIIVSLLSLLPTMLWLGAVGWRLWRMAAAPR